MEKFSKDEYIPEDKIPKFLGKVVYFHDIEIPVVDWLNYMHISTERIINEPNAEVRRVLISLKGVDNFLKDGGAEPVTDEDSRGYQVVKIPLNDQYGDNNEWYFLKMVNSTLEKSTVESITRDGVVGGNVNEKGLKTYFLRLPKDLIKPGLTNEEAVAWTFAGCKAKPGAIYNNRTDQAIVKSRTIEKFDEDKREFTFQARQGDVFIRKVANSYDDLMKDLLANDDGYDPYEYNPEVES